MRLPDVSVHPYARMARNRPFARFWLAQTISLLGDRLHQVALAVLVLGVTGSAPLTALVFLAATLPNLVIGPLAGVFVDRWDRRRLMIASDLIRAGLVLTLPLVVVFAPLATLPITFALTTASLFFRPAKSAVTQRLVDAPDLLHANSALWVADTLADLAGYALAALVVAILGPWLALAFVLDSLSYLVSAALLAGLPIGGRPSPVGTSIRAEFQAGSDS